MILNEPFSVEGHTDKLDDDGMKRPPIQQSKVNYANFHALEHEILNIIARVYKIPLKMLIQPAECNHHEKGANTTIN